MSTMKRKQNNKHVKIVIGSVMCMLLVMTVGYAAFSTKLNITAKGNVKEMVASKLLKKTMVATGDDLYADTYENGRYVYKGANPNNYITFNNEEWRIMAVEADGTLKVRKNESIGDRAFDSSGYRDSTSNGAGGTYCALGSSGCNAWAASDNFVNGTKAGTVLKDAELNTYLNGTYYNKLSSDAKGKIQTHSFGIGAVTYNNTDLVAQIASENGTTWTGNIGLMSVSDYLRANTNISQCGNLSINNTNYSTCKTTDYLFSSDYPWTISSFNGDPSDILYMGLSGSFGSYNAGSFRSVYPVLYLKSDITLSGEGTSSNPYVIE